MDKIKPSPPRYSADAVNKAIESTRRSGQRVSKRETIMIHALLRGNDK
jgi:hypothetical protein